MFRSCCNPGTASIEQAVLWQEWPPPSRLGVRLALAKAVQGQTLRHIPSTCDCLAMMANTCNIWKDDLLCYGYQFMRKRH